MAAAMAMAMVMFCGQNGLGDFGICWASVLQFRERARFSGSLTIYRVQMRVDQMDQMDILGVPCQAPASK